jgi:cytidylate kinase
MGGAVRRLVVAVDGPSGSGKSTISRRLALSLHARYLDTGAMYRAVTWAVLRDGVDPEDQAAVAEVARRTGLTVGTDPRCSQVEVDGTPVDRPIRGPEVTQSVSAVASVPEVRALLVAQQRRIIVDAVRVVVEGRDIGTVVAPDADLKIYLTASADERARRRSAETATAYAATAADLARRDAIDSGRVADPLRQADDAVIVDTTGLDIDQVVAKLAALLRDRVATA